MMRGGECLSVVKMILGVSVLVFPLVCTAATKAPKGLSHASSGTFAGTYKVARSFPLTKSVHGIDGILQLLQDTRLPKYVYGRPMGTPFRDSYLEDAKLRPLFKDSPPLGAVLRILSKCQGEDCVSLRESHTFDDVPVAGLTELNLTGKRPIFLLTLDLTASFGSYSGPVTSFYDVVDGKLKQIEYVDAKTGNKDKITLMRSLKTNWKLAASADGKTRDILHVACRPDFDEKDKDKIGFIVYYERIHFDGTQWVRYGNQEKGLWEADDEKGMPPLSKFPKGNER